MAPTISRRTLTPPRQAAMRCAVQRSTSVGAHKPGRTIARLTDAEVAKRMPRFRRIVARAQLDARVAKAERARQAKAGA